MRTTVDSTDLDPRSDAGEQESRLAQLERDNEAMRLEVIRARHSLLVNRDHVIGTEAEIGRLNRDVIRLQADLVEARKKILALQKRKNGLIARVEQLQASLVTARTRNQALRAELDRHASAPVSMSRRVARRLRAGRR